MHDGVGFDDGDRRLAAVTSRDFGSGVLLLDDCVYGAACTGTARLLDTAPWSRGHGGHVEGGACSGGGSGEPPSERERAARGGGKNWRVRASPRERPGGFISLHGGQ